MVEDLAEGHLIVVRGGVFQREDPRLFYDGLEEEAAEMLNGLDKALPFELDHVEQLGFDSDGVGGIALDVQVVCWKRDGKAVE